MGKGDNIREYDPHTISTRKTFVRIYSAYHPSNQHYTDTHTCTQHTIKQSFSSIRECFTFTFRDVLFLFFCR